LAKDRSEHDWEEQHSGGGSVTGGSSTGRHVVPGYDPAAHGFAKLDEPEIYTPPQDKHEASCWYSPWLEKDEVAWSDAERAVYSCLVGAFEKTGATEKLKQHLGTDLGLRLSYHGPVSIEEPIDPEPQTVLEEELEELLVKEHKDYAICHVQLSNAPASGYVLRLSITALPRAKRELTRGRQAADHPRVERVEKDRQQPEEQLDLKSEALPERREAILPAPRFSLAEIREVFEDLHRRMADRVEGELSRLHSTEWSGTTDDEKKVLAREVTELVKRTGLRLYAEKRDAETGEVKQIPVTVRFHRGVFELTAAGGVYVGSSSSWPSLCVGSKLLEASEGVSD